MRLLSRYAPVQELVDSTGDGFQADRLEVPPKAQKLLGEKPRLNYNVQERVAERRDSLQNGGIPIPPKAQKLLGEKVRPKHNRNHPLKHSDPESFWNIRDTEQKSLGTFRGSEADSDTIPGAKRGAPLPSVPVPMRSSEDLLRSSNDSTGRTGTSTYPGHQSSIESTSRQYYDASKQPLYVSQQTSESSVRDMALRRGAPPISDTSSETTLIARPLKNAMKHRRPGKDRRASDEHKRERKIDLTSLFPLPKTSAGITSSGQFSRSLGQGQSSNYLEFFPQDTVHAQVARHGSKLRLEKDNRTKPLPKQPSDSNAGRAKVFESDVYDSKKTNVYRPPKGAKNWFDGFDISSDEDESEAVELPPVELPANEIPRVREALPSVFRPYGTPMREFIVPYQESTGPEIENTTLLTRTSEEAMRPRMQIKNSQSPIAAEDASSGVLADRKRSGESRLAHSRLGAQSVLSLSDESGGEEMRSPGARSMGNETVVLEEASSLEIQRPSAPVRKLNGQTSEAQVRRVDSAPPRSRSVQEKLIDNTTPPPVLRRSNGSALSDPSPGARRKLSALRESPGQSFPRRRRTNESNERDGAESAGGETSSSFPTDASRMMAVTEEEMMLLELMRQKRAAMQNDSFTEGYRVALQEERHHLAQGQGFTHDYRSSNLKTKNRPSVRRRNTSKTESLLREGMEQRRRMSAIRKEDVDKAFKMGRFLAMEPPNDERPPKIERFLVMAPGLAGEFSGRPVSGTEIEIESRYDEIEETEEGVESSLDEKEEDEEKEKQDYETCVLYDLFDGEELNSRLDEEDEEREEKEEMKTPKQAQSFSPMQRLTDQVRGLPSQDPQANGKHVSDHFGKPQSGLVSSHDAETADTGALPTLPTDDILEQSILYDNEGRELLSPKVYTPSIRSPAKTPNPPSPRPLETDLEKLSDKNPSEFKVESPGIPVATTWARPSSLKHPRPQRQPPVLDFTPLEPQPAPSVTTSGPSPLTPTFGPAPLSPDGTASEITGVDDVSIPSERCVMDSEVPQPLKSHPVNPGVDRKSSKSRPSPSVSPFSQKAPGRITSMTSITSAGEDVLAAWAELGGGSDALAFRRKRNR